MEEQEENVRIKRDGKHRGIDFTDLSEEEMNRFLDERLESGGWETEYRWVRSLAIRLGLTVQNLGAELDSFITQMKEHRVPLNSIIAEVKEQEVVLDSVIAQLKERGFVLKREK